MSSIRCRLPIEFSHIARIHKLKVKPEAFSMFCLSKPQSLFLSYQTIVYLLIILEDEARFLLIQIQVEKSFVFSNYYPDSVSLGFGRK